MRDACAAAVDAALGAGASYADARAAVRRSQSVRTKNGRVETLSDGESEGIGVRVLVGGGWGFASDRRLSPEGARAAALRACGFAAAAAAPNRGCSRRSTRAPVRTGRPVGQHPFAVPLDEKVALCLRIEESLRHADVKVAEALLRAQGERKLFVSSDGIEVDQELVECGGGMQAVAIRDGVVQSRSYPSLHVGSCAQAGWEHVESLVLESQGPRLAEEAARCSARTSAPQE